jgi:hypothetical protein
MTFKVPELRSVHMWHSICKIMATESPGIINRWGNGTINMTSLAKLSRNWTTIDSISW